MLQKRIKVVVVPRRSRNSPSVEKHFGDAQGNFLLDHKLMARKRGKKGSSQFSGI